jgi:hypothetical protein
MTGVLCVYSRKIVPKDEGSSNNIEHLTSTNLTQAILNKISSTVSKNTCHTVTPVTQISPVHLSEVSLDFILSHLSDPIWPRTISTKASGGRQVIVNSREEVFAYFKAANYFDCRISAYPYWWSSTLSNFIGIRNTIPPNFIMIDLDLSNSNGETSTTNRVLRKILQRITYLLNITPTVIWSGNGYHIYIPISAVVLEDIKEFANIEQVSTKFLRFAEWYLSSGKSDPAHNSSVSLNNCMLRAPGTYNSKNNAQVSIIKRWDNNRPGMTLLLGSFCAHLKDQKLKQQRFVQEVTTTTTSSVVGNIPWIDRLLQTPISNGRKYSIWRILVPYLVNRKSLSVKQSTGLITDWLNRCAQLARLNFNSNSRIDYALRHVGKYGPVHPEMLRKEHDTLYELLKTQGVL